jgi:hypothetical protein
MNSTFRDNESSVFVVETSQHGKDGWPSTQRLRFRGKQENSRFSKKPDHVGMAIGMLIAHRMVIPANAISDPPPM